jgi:hypothetical protein
MPFSHDDVKDNGLTIMTGANRRLDITHTEATTFAQATSTYSVGNKVGISVSLVGGTPSGRAARVAAITDGTITATSTGAADDAQFWAITDTTGSRLLATGALTASQMVTSGNSFSLAQFDAYTITNPA